MLYHGAVIRDVHRTIDYQATKNFGWFVEQVTGARHTGDVDKSRALFADVLKLIGNSAYGNLIEAVENSVQHTSSRVINHWSLSDASSRWI